MTYLHEERVPSRGANLTCVPHKESTAVALYSKVLQAQCRHKGHNTWSSNRNKHQRWYGLVFGQWPWLAATRERTRRAKGDSSHLVLLLRGTVDSMTLSRAIWCATQHLQSALQEHKQSVW